MLVHGLEGSASSGYVLGNAARLVGPRVAMWCGMNMRSCGGSDGPGPDHLPLGALGRCCFGGGGRWCASKGVARIALVGYSMGGNLVLKYAGEQGERHGALRAVVGVSPLMDLAPSSAALHRWSNRLYEQRFLRAMKRRLRLKAALFPELYAQLEQEGVYVRIRTMRDFDGEIVARYGGFRDADDYYERVRSSRYAAGLRVPTLILQAEDDPFIRTLPATRGALRANPFVTLVETKHGGHCAFVADAEGSREGRWAEETLARWLASGVAA